MRGLEDVPHSAAERNDIVCEYADVCGVKLTGCWIGMETTPVFVRFCFYSIPGQDAELLLFRTVSVRHQRLCAPSAASATALD